MRVVLATPEAVPFAKTGGLADVAGALPKALRALGLDVALILPYYRQAREAFGRQTTDARAPVAPIPVGSKTVAAAVRHTTLPGTDVPVYFVDCPAYYDRDELYRAPDGKDYRDNCERFVLFSRAVLEASKALGLRPHVVHCHDWQTALVPVYLRTLYAGDPALHGVRSLLTLHNIGYQGKFPRAAFALTGLDASLFSIDGLEFYGDVNLLKGGIAYATVLNTVSRRYAKEIQSDAEHGKGLQGVLASRAADLHGVLNGIDYGVWDPQTDGLLPANYGPADRAGKAQCKAALQKEFGLPPLDVPLLATISRLDVQKGIDLLIEIMETLTGQDLQFVLLGTGDPTLERQLARLNDTCAGTFRARLAYDNRLAHLIEAGADLFVMPSRYEPCGLNQLISLKYGTVPVVRKTGGLADSITNCTPTSLGKGTANGFSFQGSSARALLAAIQRALRLFADRRAWNRLVRVAMLQDWSWGASAPGYVELYEKALR